MPTKAVRIPAFTGINNVLSPERCRITDVQSALNVDIHDDGTMRKRQGYRLIKSGTISSLYAHEGEIYFVESNTLKKFKPTNGETTTLATGVCYVRDMEYLLLNGILYYSDGDTCGAIDGLANRAWGIAPPPDVAVSATVGDLIPGNYQVCYTYIAKDGRESGASVSASVNASGGGLTVGLTASDDAEVNAIALYMTPVDGSTFYFFGLYNNSSQTATIRGGNVAANRECRTLHMGPPHPSEKMCFYRGRVYFAVGNIVWFTEPWNYELVSYDRNFFPCNAKVTMLVPVEGGIWVGTEAEFFFLGGTDPHMEGGMQIRNYGKPGVVDGTAVSMDGRFVGPEGVPGRIALWTSSSGVFAGMGDGSVQNMTQGRYKLRAAQTGSALVSEVDGNCQYIVSLLEATNAGFPAVYGISASGTGSSS